MHLPFFTYLTSCIYGRADKLGRSRLDIMIHSSQMVSLYIRRNLVPKDEEQQTKLTTDSDTYQYI